MTSRQYSESCLMSESYELLAELSKALHSAVTLLGRLELRVTELDGNVTILDSRLNETSAQLQRANNTLRTLIEIVDPGIWHDGHANMDDLIDTVRALKTQLHIDRWQRGEETHIGEEDEHQESPD